jgi:hypothetical protein
MNSTVPPLSDYQRDRIARFAAASENLHQNRLLLTTPGMTKPALALAMRAKKPAVVSAPALEKATQACRALMTYRRRSRLATRLLPLLIVVAGAAVAYVWSRASAATAMSVALLLLIAIAGVKLYFSYFALRPILERYQLTDEEAHFALNEVMGDPRWDA